tara:strand:- start:21 stop:488 length:468 start_codon:yes stop_codon:yes gene_type:complete
MKFTTLILYDVIWGILFFPITKILFKYTNIDKYFINFPIMVLKPKDTFYKFFYNLRGKNYNLTSENSKKDKTHYFITTWSILHAIYFIIRGILVPDLYVYHIIYSIIFEITEILFNCHDMMDIIINIVFYYFGSKLSPKISKLPILNKIPIRKFK